MAPDTANGEYRTAWWDQRTTGLVNPFDAGLKHLLELDPDGFLAGFGLATRHPIRVLDSDVATVHMRVDKVLRIDGPNPWLIHVEFQASHDPRLPARLLEYNVFLEHRHRLPVRSVALLLRQEADGRELAGVERRVLPDREVYHEFRYRVVRLWEQSAEQLLTSGVVTLPWRHSPT